MTASIPITAGRLPRHEIIESRNASNRYENAYLHARWVMQAGDFIQILGWMLGGIIFCGVIFTAHTVLTPLTPAADWIPPARLFVGAIITVLFFWLVGELLYVRGEDLEATLDCAVNSSPFLSDEQRAKVMSLS